MRHAVIGTAGHVDHGKTSLVFALTDVQTDRLPEEQRRGITIELGFAPWRIRDDLLVSIIDAPGHRKLVHHMIAGASGIDIVLLVVAADEGVMPQTREHMAACELLGVDRAVIAVTKVDRVDADLAELAGEEARELLQEHGIEAEVVVCSAKTGEGIEAVRQAVLAAIDASEQHAVSDRRVRLSVDRAFSVHGSGTVITGTLVEGELAVGSQLRILAPGRENTALARKLHVHGEACELAQAPTRLAINLGGATLDDVKRGDVITDDAHVAPTRIIDAWLQTRARVRRGRDASIFIGPSRSTAKLQPIAGSETERGMLVRLRLTNPIVTFGGDRFVLRGAKVDGPAGAVFGGGVVLDAHTPRSIRAKKRSELLAALHRRDAAAAMVALAYETSPRPVYRKALLARFNLPAQVLTEASGDLVAVGQVGWVAPAALQQLEQQALALVEAHHAAAPLDPGLPRQTLREKLASIAGDEVAALTLERVTADGRLVVAGKVFRHAEFRGVDANSAEGKALATAREYMQSMGLEGRNENKLLQQIGGERRIGFVE